MNSVKKWMIFSIAIVLTVFHLYSGGVQIFPALQQRGVHFGLTLALIFLLYPMVKNNDKQNQRFSIIMDIVLALVTIILGVYIYQNFINLTTFLNQPTQLMVIAGALMIILTLEATRRIIGWALPIISLLFLAYALWGSNLPLLFAHSGFTLDRLVTQVGLSSQGILGTPLGVSATYVVLFIMFGTFLERSGTGKFLIDLAFSAVGKFRGGAAKVAVVASAFTGSVNGYAVSNVATTGVLTIPLIKRSGYSSRYAAAVESAASTGSMILPPVMGAVAFLIADYLQIEFYKVALAAVIPAILYFLAIFIMVDLRAARIENTKMSSDKPLYKVNRLTDELKEKGHLIIPLLVLIYLLIIQQVSPSYAAFWSIITVPTVCLLRKETRMSIKDILGALEQGAKISLVVAAACACAGIVIGVIELTGIGLRFSGILVELSNGNLFVLLLLTMIASIVMGMGLPPVASYIILAVIAAPAITQLGVPDIAAHLFIFYYGTLSAITPPVAIAAYTAGGIAKADPLKTSLTAVKLALVAFLIPFMFVYGPSLILEGSTLNIATAFITAVVGIFSLSVSLEGYWKIKVHPISRILLMTGALLSISVGILLDIIGIIVISLVMLYEWKVTKERVANVTAEQAQPPQQTSHAGQ
ncbi:TRAP transporter, 4TM/12TM fusion protein [Alteribacillus persepolensis]|uniref:TRAP transporter, 4TM/12TM fusion protein n=1 Tax=Alteribacillus persepolensis TaxID=568899 RepID=A0A1G7Y6G0_9BACI|nr:TRAP transporter permease [Alteribacillus persepolensis]SDG91947.1 TRAP transporter, 4TM/12TM fusion protein [Alteribacillus persepolensis]